VQTVIPQREEPARAPAGVASFAHVQAHETVGVFCVGEDLGAEIGVAVEVHQAAADAGFERWDARH